MSRIYHKCLVCLAARETRAGNGSGDGGAHARAQAPGTQQQRSHLRASTINAASSPPIDHYSDLTRAIMSSDPFPSPSRSNLNSIFNAALRTYKEKTGKDITSHPLATEPQSCDSPDAILAVLRRQIPTPDQSQSGDERSEKCLIPTITILYTLSGTLGEGVGLVIITMLSLL